VSKRAPLLITLACTSEKRATGTISGHIRHPQVRRRLRSEVRAHRSRCQPQPKPSSRSQPMVPGIAALRSFQLVGQALTDCQLVERLGLCALWRDEEFPSTQWKAALFPPGAPSIPFQRETPSGRPSRSQSQSFRWSLALGASRQARSRASESPGPRSAKGCSNLNCPKRAVARSS